jgi:hypothetical protein
MEDRLDATEFWAKGWSRENELKEESKALRAGNADHLL